MKVFFDDVGYYIEFEHNFEEIKCLHYNQFDECVKILLTSSQYIKYIGTETSRKFNVSDIKIKKVIEYMKDNMWNLK